MNLILANTNFSNREFGSLTDAVYCSTDFKDYKDYSPTPLQEDLSPGGRTDIHGVCPYANSFKNITIFGRIDLKDLLYLALRTVTVGSWRSRLLTSVRFQQPTRILFTLRTSRPIRTIRPGTMRLNRHKSVFVLSVPKVRRQFHGEATPRGNLLG